jgi:hypothetical protein
MSVKKSQEQALVAVKKAETMHKLFVDAVAKIEVSINVWIFVNEVSSFMCCVETFETRT